MTEQKLNKTIMILCGVLIAAYSVGLCITHDLFEGPAYLSALIGAGLVGLPMLISYRKTGNVLKLIPIVLTVILFVALIGFRYWDWKRGFYYLFNAVWPVICYGVISYVTGKIKSKSNLWFGMLLYNISVVSVIYIVQEHWYRFAVADVIAEAYLYIISQIALFLCIKKQGFSKKEIAVYLICNIVFPVIWFFTQDRIGEIIASLNYSFSSVDADGGYNNWLAQRANLLKSNINGDFSNIYRWHIYNIASDCPLSYFYSEGHAWLSAIIVAVTVAMSGLLIKLAVVSRENNWLKIIIAAFVLKNIIGLLVNIFVFYSTSIDIMFIDNIFDVVPMLWIFFSSKKTLAIQK